MGDLCSFGLAELSGGRNDGSTWTVDCNLLEDTGGYFQCPVPVLARHRHRFARLNGLDEFGLLMLNRVGWFGLGFDFV